jgi:hypothetical protein
MAAPDVLLPSQIRPSEILDSPELKLLRELLLSAIADVAVPAHHVCCRVSCKCLKKARLAWSWIDGEPGASISFEMACAAFGLAPDEMRKRIARCVADHSPQAGKRRLSLKAWRLETSTSSGRIRSQPAAPAAPVHRVRIDAI